MDLGCPQVIRLTPSNHQLLARLDSFVSVQSSFPPALGSLGRPEPLPSARFCFQRDPPPCQKVYFSPSRLQMDGVF